MSAVPKKIQTNKIFFWAKIYPKKIPFFCPYFWDQIFFLTIFFGPKGPYLLGTWSIGSTPTSPHVSRLGPLEDWTMVWIPGQ